MIKNTDKKYSINTEEIKESMKKVIAGGITASLLFVTLSTGRSADRGEYSVPDDVSAQTISNTYEEENIPDSYSKEREPVEKAEEEVSADKQEVFDSGEVSEEACGYGEFSAYYLDAFDDLDYSEFDDKFIDSYKNGYYVIDGMNYTITEVCICMDKDGFFHLIKAGDMDTDIVTHQIFQYQSFGVVRLRDTSAFYKMYKDGVFVDEKIVIDNGVYNEYILGWDGELQYEIPELRVAHEINNKMKHMG